MKLVEEAKAAKGSLRCVHGRATGDTGRAKLSGSFVGFKL